MALAAEEGVQETKSMKARRGRSSYLQERVLGHVDPGAKAIQIILQAIADSFWSTVMRARNEINNTTLLCLINKPIGWKPAF